MAYLIKKTFHSRRCTSEKTILARFKKVFGEDTDQEKINEQFTWYTKRLHECIRLGGQMTKYQRVSHALLRRTPKKGPCANTKTLTRVSAVVSIQLCILIKPPQWAVNVLPMMRTLLNLINILFQSTRRPKFYYLSPGHCPILTPFLLTLCTPMAHQIYHYMLILPIFLYYLGLYRRMT